MPALDTVVDISTRIAGGAAAPGEYGRGLLITADDALSAGGSGRIATLRSADAGEELFDSGDALDAVNIWFSADPKPQALYVAHWAPAAVATVLRSEGAISGAANAGAFNANNGSFVIDGQTVDSLDLSDDASYTAIATAIQSAIQALGGKFAGATFAYDATLGFSLTLSGPETIDPPYLTDTGDSSDTDIAAALRMGAGDAVYRQGSAAETVTNAISEAVGLTGANPPSVVMLADDVPATDPQGADGNVTTRVAAAYCQANNLVFCFTDYTAQALVSGDATSQAALALAASELYVSSFWSESGEIPHVAAAAIMSAQDLDGPASVITPHGKPLPGVQPSEVTAAQLDELRRKRTSVYRNIAGAAALDGGFTSRADGWLDAVWWLKWMENKLSFAVWNGIVGARRFTTALLADTLGETMELGVSNGGIQPGRTVSAAIKADIIATTGNRAFDGVLSAGYLVWVDTSPSASDRSNRIGRFKIWATGSDAIHRVLGDLTFQN